MHTSITRLCVAVAGASLLSTLAVTGASVPGTASLALAGASSAGPSRATAAPGGQLWAFRYGDAYTDNHASSVAVSPDGGTVFVTGSSTGISSYADYATIAYNAVTGARLWIKRYNGPSSNSSNNAASMAVSSTGGGRVFVTGTSISPLTDSPNFATVAYDASTGAVAWIAYPESEDYLWASSLAVSPTDGTVFVTGSWTYVAPDYEGYSYLTVAYSG